jgi:hypothetical protein
MGCYVNPVEQSKEQWLEENGTLVPGPIVPSQEFLPVCLVDNGYFTAAGIGFDQREVDAFSYPDPRPKKWYKVARDKLRLVSNLSKYEERLRG